MTKARAVISNSKSTYCNVKTSFTMRFTWTWHHRIGSKIISFQASISICRYYECIRRICSQSYPFSNNSNRLGITWLVNSLICCSLMYSDCVTVINNILYVTWIHRLLVAKAYDFLLELVCIYNKEPTFWNIFVCSEDINRKPRHS